MKVLKFGGAALRDAQAIQHAASIVAQTGPCVVVVSAMQGVTDRLQVQHLSEEESEQLLAELKVRHEQALAPFADDEANARLALELEHLERLLYGIAYTQEVTPRLQDLLASYGERLVAPIVAAAIRATGMAARSFDAAEASVATHGPFGNARPDFETMRRAAGPALQTAQPGVAVVTGFYGVDANGEATVFGRGGSDYVACLVAAAIDAKAVELWKDQPGFMTADPRVVDGARLVPRLGYDEAGELAHFGAKVIHPRAVEPVASQEIPIYIRSLSDPSAPGSIIQGHVDNAPELVRSAASKDHLALLKLNGPGMAYTPGVAKRVFDILADANINILNMSTSQATFALLLHENDLQQAHTALKPLVGGVIQSIEACPQRSLVCVVGRGLGETPGSAARILDAVSKAGVNVEMISLGASDIAIDFIIRAADRDAALRGVHAAFLESA